MNIEYVMFKRCNLAYVERSHIKVFLPITASLQSPTMENPVDRMIRLMALAVGVVSLLVYVVFHFV